MRAIQKQSRGSESLRKAHAHPPQTPEQAQTRWSSFKGKKDLKNSLLEEQYALCCYTELRADQEQLGYHIEHVENKAQNPGRTFDYSNLAASALQSEDLARLRHEAFGGHAQGKQSGVSMTTFVSPHQSDYARFFRYLSDGRVVPAMNLNEDDTARSRYTIETLNLNSPFLVTRRQQWWRELDQLFEDHLEKDWDLVCLAAVDLIPTQKKLSPFFSLTRGFYGALGEQVLQQQAPELL
jgi:uncharacterized protein (TIGR02646 family)